MKLFFPDNIFTQMIVKNLPEGIKSSITFQPSSLLTTALNETPEAAALIPTTDLIKNKDLFVSKSFGISFDNMLCNSYIYYAPGEKEISKMNLFGDISSVEVILSKIFIKEMYNTDVEIGILTDESKIEERNVIIAGSKNFSSEMYMGGISFAEEIIEILNLPFINYVLASKEGSILHNINKGFENISAKVYESAEDILSEEKFSINTKQFINGNISSFIMKFDEQDLEGINQLIRLPFFHGIIDDIVEVKFV